MAASASCHLTLAFFLLVACAASCHATSYDILDFEMGRRHGRWMAEQGRVYKDEAERTRRFKIFKANVKFIDDFNDAGEHNYTLGVNQFADLTNDEFRAMYAAGVGVPGAAEELEKRSAASSHDASKPAAVDWRAKGAVSYVRDQGKCGSCWAIVVAGVVEGLIKIKKGVLFNLSSQQLIDCDRQNMGCRGGFTEWGYEYINRTRGLTTESNYTFTGVQGTCNLTKANQAVAHIKGYKRVPRNNEKELATAVAKQPVAVVVDGQNDYWRFYKAGVFNGKCSDQTRKMTHAVVLVGYGVNKMKTNYWIVKNSWGSRWGESGYMRLLKDHSSATGMCGVATHPSYPTI